MTRHLIVRRIEFTERPVRFRMPVRFVAAKLEDAHPGFRACRDRAIRDGTISTGSLRQPGFASGVDSARVG